MIHVIMRQFVHAFFIMNAMKIVSIVRTLIGKTETREYMVVDWRMSMDFDEEFGLEKKRYEVEHKEDWREWCNKIPSLHFKKKWDVKVIPPFGGALVRFYVKYNNKYVSVYLDVYDRLGCMSEPYWEMYDGHDNLRFQLNDTDGLMSHIEMTLS